MKRIIILLYCLAVCLIGQTQTTITAETPYFYDEFQIGTVFFLNGEQSRAKLNYNFVLQEMQFINHQTDQILNLVRDHTLTHIKIGKDIFVPVGRQGYAFVIQDGPITLLEKRQLVQEERKTGAYGMPAATASIDNLTHFNFSNASDITLSSGTMGAVRTVATDGSRAVTWSGTGDEINNTGASQPRYISQPIYYKVLTEYYLMKDRRTYAATRRNYIRLYSQIRPQLEEFLKENNVDFKNDQHLRGLLMFSNSLLKAE